MTSRHRQPTGKTSPPARDRIDLRAPSEWIARVEKQATRLGLNLSNYVRQAVTLKLEADEATDPGV